MASDRSDNLLRGRQGVLVLPKAQHGPSVRFESARRRYVSTMVCLDFLPPVELVRRWLRAVDRTAVPEASVDEHGHPACRKRNIGSYWPAAGRSDRMIHAKTKTGAVKRRSQRALRSAVSTAIGSHDLPAHLGHVGP